MDTIRVLLRKKALFMINVYPLEVITRQMIGIINIFFVAGKDRVHARQTTIASPSTYYKSDGNVSIVE